jgi:hypothetical protein
VNALPDWFWISLLAVGAVLLVGARVYAARSRRKALRSAAEALGLGMSKKTRPISGRESKKFNLFSRGNSGKWINIYSDPIGGRLLFDFRYVFGLPFIASHRCADGCRILGGANRFAGFPTDAGYFSGPDRAQAGL